MIRRYAWIKKYGNRHMRFPLVPGPGDILGNRNEPAQARRHTCLEMVFPPGECVTPVRRHYSPVWRHYSREKPAGIRCVHSGGYPALP